QDLYRSGETSGVTDASSIAQAAGPIVYSKWQQSIPHNVVTVIQGGGPRRFIKLADNTWQPPKGEHATLTESTAPFLAAPACYENGNINGNTYSVVPTYGWGYDRKDVGGALAYPANHIFTLTNANG